MELWVRSQSKQTLIKAEKIFTEDEEVYATTNSEFNERIGVYKSKERALEILDEIQKLLMPIMKSTPIIEEDIKPEYTYRHYVKTGFNTEVIQLNTYVYEMPIE